MPRKTVEVVFIIRTYEILRESDAHLVLVVETRTQDGHLVDLMVVDPLDYDDEDDDL